MFEKAEVDVNLNLTRESGGFGTVEVFDHVPEYVEFKKGINTMIYNPGRRNNYNYRVKFPLRGYYSVGPTNVRIADHFNIFYTDEEIQEKEPVTVFPRITGLKEFRLKSKRYIHFPGEFLMRQPGASTEFYSIRDYVKGDPFKKINWKVYARKRELMVNEFEKENICDTVLFMDARNISNVGTVLDNTLEKSVKLGLGVSNFLILHRNQIGVVVYNDQVNVLPPKPGMQQRDDILRFLTGIYSRGWAEFRVALYYARPFIKSKTTLIIITTLDYDQSFFSTMEELVALNHKIMIITPSSVDFEINAIEYDGPDEKIRLVRENRDNFILQLRGMGIDVIECGPEESVEEIVNRVSNELLR
jgi:uncharacterized protein (DUF58 family)